MAEEVEFRNLKQFLDGEKTRQSYLQLWTHRGLMGGGLFRILQHPLLDSEELRVS